MKITYSIQVCNESRELFSLLNFLCKLKDPEDNINVVVDSLHTTDKVKLVTDHFKSDITVYEKPFETFYKNVTFHKTKATGDYIFHIDADEMPQESLILGMKNVIKSSGADTISVPRINIHPGATTKFLTDMQFHVNQCGWINWPDYQSRVYRNCDEVTWTDELHTKLTGGSAIALQADPLVALWHIKSIEKQESRWTKDDSGEYTISAPTGKLYDILM
jgi:hypothetical protein